MFCAHKLELGSAVVSTFAFPLALTFAFYIHSPTISPGPAGSTQAEGDMTSNLTQLQQGELLQKAAYAQPPIAHLTGLAQVLVAILATVLALTTVVVALRIYVKAWMKQSVWLWDDTFAVLGFVSPLLTLQREKSLWNQHANCTAIAREPTSVQLYLRLSLLATGWGSETPVSPHS